MALLSGLARPFCVLGMTLFPLLALAAPQPVTLETVSLQRPTETLLVNGTLVANQSARLSASVSGLVSALHVDIGDRVQAGTPLLELDSELNRLALQQARASYRQQQATLADTRRQLDEASSLIAKRSIAASEVRSLESQVQVAEAALAASQSEVARQQALLERHTLNAPFEGVVSAKLTEIGEWVTPGTAVLELVGTENLHADFAIPQRYFPRINRETPLTVTPEAGRQEARIEARVAAIVPVNDPMARTFILRAEISESGLIPGMALQGSLLLQGEDEQPMVARDALLRDAQGNVSVWLAEKQGDDMVARRKSIRVAEGQSDPVVVLEGLSAGDRVVVRGNEGLQDGDALQVVR